MDRTEFLILKNLIEHKEFSQKVSPFVDAKYFDDYIGRILSKHYTIFINKYKNIPTYEELKVDISRNTKLTDKQVEDSLSELETIKVEKVEELTTDYLIDLTEKHFQEVALEKCILKGAEILNDEDKKLNKHMLPDMMRDALKISFKNTIGQEYGTDKQIEGQFEYYHHPESKYPLTDWPTFNTLLRGGCMKKKLHIYIAGTNVGKSTALVNTAIQLIKGGCNVLYVTAEDDENSINERIDGNLIDVNTEQLPLFSKEKYKNKLEEIKKTSEGRLIIKEYPTSFANVNHIRALLDELEIKCDFSPDFIIFDYLNIFSSIRYKNIGDTYNYVKAISEEFRGLAVEKNVGIWTATQLNRGGYSSSDPDLTDTSESWGIPNTSDLMVAIIENDNLKIENKYLFKILKSRKYGKVDPRTCKWLMGVNKDKQQIYELKNPREGIAIEDSTTQQQQNNTLNNKNSKFKSVKTNWNFGETK